MRRLLISRRDLATVEDQATDALPEECCGLLLGRAVSPRTVEVARVVPCANRAADGGRRFTIAPEDLLEAHRRASCCGEKVVGTYHSHPLGGAVPSALDGESAWAGASYLIIGLDGRRPGECRAWRFTDGSFMEERLVVVAGEELEATG